jgi:deoxyadenosine/deoxycytidine kinase
MPTTQPKKIITIIGNIGSGKSTALPLVAKHLKAQTIQADDLFQTTDPFSQSYLHDMGRWAFANELWLTVTRVKLIKKELRQSSKKICVIDSGLLMSWVYTHSHFVAGRISEAEWQFYQELYEDYSGDLLENSSVIFLDYSIPTLLKRIAKRGRQYELDFYTEQYLQELQGGLEDIKKLLSRKKTKVVVIPEKSVPDFEANEEDAQMLLNLVTSISI